LTKHLSDAERAESEVYQNMGKILEGITPSME